MQVKNILVTNKDIFIEFLIKELINNRISYVQIDNEFHFEDKIYRFFDKKDYQREVAAKLVTETMHLIDIKDLGSKDSESGPFIKINENSKLDYTPNEKLRLNKNYLKEQNRQYQIQMRNNFRNKRK